MREGISKVNPNMDVSIEIDKFSCMGNLLWWCEFSVSTFTKSDFLMAFSLYTN